MKPKYYDIISRINEIPLWYNQDGVPRYVAFHPKHSSNFHADEVLLLRIQCFLNSIKHIRAKGGASFGRVK